MRVSVSTSKKGFIVKSYEERIGRVEFRSIGANKLATQPIRSFVRRRLRENRSANTTKNDHISHEDLCSRSTL